MSRPHIPVALTIAGSDSGGGAGVQADLKTFTAMGVFGTSALTCITAQNPDAVTGIEAVSPKLIAAQIKAVQAGFPVAATKTGMVFSDSVIRAVVRCLRQSLTGPLVVDPVMVSTSGARLLRRNAMDAMLNGLLPLATVLTPNRDEAEILAGGQIRTLQQLQKAARVIARRFNTACLAKGGHLAGTEVVDVLCTGDDDLTLYTAPRVRIRGTHGTGCTFSAALTAALALGAGVDILVAGFEARPAAEAAARLRALLGDQRFEDWQKQNDLVFQQAGRFTSELKQPAETASQVYQAIEELRAGLPALRTAWETDRDAVRQAVQERRAEFRQRLDRILEGVPAGRVNGIIDHWLDDAIREAWHRP
ncbi:MAG: bifunctional hydroxymethylpyrimidine kinase/phosphomethylpyrimidine kinase [Verrucomicrobiota bacterium]